MKTGQLDLECQCGCGTKLRIRDMGDKMFEFNVKKRRVKLWEGVVLRGSELKLIKQFLKHE